MLQRQGLITIFDENLEPRAIFSFAGMKKR